MPKSKKHGKASQSRRPAAAAHPAESLKKTGNVPEGLVRQDPPELLTEETCAQSSAEAKAASTLISPAEDKNASPKEEEAVEGTVITEEESSQAIAEDLAKQEAAATKATGAAQENPAATHAAQGSLRLLQSRIIGNNYVLVRVLAICTVLAAAVSLKNGLLLSAAAVVVSVPLYLIMAALYDLIPQRHSLPAAVLFGAALMTPVYFLSERVLPGVTASVGIFLPLTLINAAAGAGLEKHADIRHAILNGLGDSLGFSAVVLIFSVLRELIGSGRIWGKAVPGLTHIAFGYLLTPSGAFLLLGFAVAGMQAYRSHKNRSDADREDQ